MSSLSGFRAAWKRFSPFGNSRPPNEDHGRRPISSTSGDPPPSTVLTGDVPTPDGAVDITHEIHRISPRPIGFGGYSDIYTGTWHTPSMGETKVAIKVIRAVPMSAESHEMPRALRHEIYVWKRLQHRNIHALCGLYEGIGPVPALVSPWCENGDIKSYLQRHADDPDIGLLKLRLLCDIMCGVKFLHGKSIVHGDIKGQNVLISDTGVATLCDFGLSRLLIEHSQSVTYTGVRGTSRWMAPEIFFDGERQSYASDIWSCGCLFIEVWNSVLPYRTKINDFQLSLALHAKELPGSQLDMPDAIWTFVQQSCNFDATSRPTALQIATHFSRQLVLQRVNRWVTLSRPIDVHASNILRQVETVSALQSAAELYTLADSELASDIVRHLSFVVVVNLKGSKSAQDPVFQWCLAKLGVGNLQLPTGVHIPTADKNRIFAVFNASREPAVLRPLARLVEQVRPGWGNDLMTVFATPVLDRPFEIDTPLRSVAWFSDGNRIVIGCSDATAHILDVANGGTLLRLVGHTGDVNQVAVSPNERLVATCSDDKSIRLWDAQTGLPFGTAMVDHDSYVRSVAFSPDGRHLISGFRDHAIRIWSTETCTTVLGPLFGYTRASSVRSVAFSPDGSRIVSCSSDTVRIWDTRTGKPILTILGHMDCVQSVAYSPDALRIASGSWDRTVRIWDATTGQQVGSPLGGHSKWVLSVAYSPDGTRIASGSVDHTVRIWNAATGASIAIFRGHTYWVTSVAFSPDGKRLASASGDGTVRIWDATNDWRRWDI